MKNDLYKLMMYNLVKEMENRDPSKELKQGEYDIFTMTGVIGIAVGKCAGEVMLDYFKKRKELLTND